MKRPLVLVALLSIPVLASSQTKLSEQWNTYCDGSVEKVRATLSYHVGSGITVESGEMVTFSGPGDCSGVPSCATVNMTRWEDLGSGDIAFIWEGTLRSCLPGTEATRFGLIILSAPDDQGGKIYHHEPFECADGPQAIIDNSDCPTLPVALGTWGWIKSLYR
jgi:hypothetical protein